MQHAGNYKALVSDKNQIIFVIKNQQKAPKEPFMVYDGGKHALLHRRKGEPILLDYLHEEIARLLKGAEEALIIEMYPDRDEVQYDYIVKIKHT